MSRHTIRRLAPVSLLTLAAMVFVPSTATAQEEMKIHVRVFATSFNPTGEELVSFPVATARTRSNVGFGGALEVQLTRRFGIEFAALYSELDWEASATIDDQALAATGDSRFIPLTGGVTVHLTPGTPFDVYAGGAIGIGLFGDGELLITPTNEAATVESDNDFIWGATIGVDVHPRGKAWGISASVRYLNAAFDDKDPTSLFPTVDINPIVVTVGVGFVF